MSDSHNVFAGAYVDRAAELRADARWLATATRSADARFVVVQKNRCLASREDGHLQLLRLTDLGAAVNPDRIVFLGLDDGSPRFAIVVDPSFAAAPEDWVSLRTLGSLLGHAEANLAAHAIGITHWRETQKFCNQCGEQTRIEAAGYAALCVNDACATRAFPRVDPAVIVLASQEDHCLLGRQSSWPEGLYSTIAGFVEPGESLEDAVRREVFEETNIRVSAVHYLSSQPWPFPASLMLGFHASATSTDIHANDGELEEARWFSRASVRAGDVVLPPPLSIARQLVDTWASADK